MAIDLDELPSPTPRPRGRRRARHASRRAVERVPRGRDRRGRLPGLPPEPGHLRPAPGRPQPDGAGEDPARPGHARAARDARLHRRRRTPGAGVTSPPARTCSSTSSQLETVARDPAPARRRSASPRREACGDTVRNVAGCHLAGACPFEVLDITPWAEATTDLLPAQPVSPSASPASSRSTSPAARPTAARRCSTTSA